MGDCAQNIHKIRETICGFCCDSGSSNIFLWKVVSKGKYWKLSEEQEDQGRHYSSGIEPRQRNRVNVKLTGEMLTKVQKITGTESAWKDEKRNHAVPSVPSVPMALKAVFDMNSVKHVPSLAVSSFLELQRVTVP